MSAGSALPRLKRHGKISQIHCKKPYGKPMLERTARANINKSAMRARV